MGNSLPLTYKGALRTLGAADRSLLNTIDALLGGLILMSPLTPFAAAWGMVDQKNEAVRWSHRLVSTVTGRMNQFGGFERQDMIKAAHGVILIAAFFDTLRATLGNKEYDELALTEQEKAHISTGSHRNEKGEHLVACLTSTSLPVPLSGGMAKGNELQAFYARLSSATLDFVHGLSAWRKLRNKKEIDRLVREIPHAATKKYTTYFLDLAKDVPEFYLWATFSELAHSRRTLDELHNELRTAIDTFAPSLGRLHNVLDALASDRADPTSNARASVGRANRSALTDPIISSALLDMIGPVELPSIEEIYQNPRFRTAPASVADAANENWWSGRPIRDDLDVFLASYLAAPDSALEPLLILGHPGAGKSLLARVLAARLPERAYTTVRVPLRRVDAAAPVLDQVQQALDEVTNRRVRWAELVDDDYHTNHVIVLDGLDELLQALSISRASYLKEVAEFQRREADQGRSVAVIVTSRTVVADRVRISPSSTIVKLEGFDHQQVGRWLSIWRNHNRDAIESGRMGELTQAAALQVEDLASQPLLLLMLALYAADPEAEEIGPRLSGASFYQRILTSFVRREVNKKAEVVADVSIDEAVEDQLWRLGITAFAMFNRDRLFIRDEELGADLVALTVSELADSGTVNTLAKLGQEAVGKFFFVYTPEAEAHRRDEVRRAFEFLHATFGEYLVAHFCVQTLQETVEHPRKSWQGGREFDDDLLFALLSHQTLTTRRTVVTFIRELIAQIEPGHCQKYSEAIGRILHGFRAQPTVRAYSQYRPLSVDRLREMAAYSANLVLLRIVTAGSGVVRFMDIVPPNHGMEWWQATVFLWRHALGASSWESISRTIDVSSADELIMRVSEQFELEAETMLLKFTKSHNDLMIYRVGASVLGKYSTPDPADPFTTIIAYLFKNGRWENTPGEAPDELIENAVSELGELDRQQIYVLQSAIVRHLFHAHRELPYEKATQWIRLYFQYTILDTDTSIFAFYVAKFNRLIIDVPELNRAGGYGKKWVPGVLLAGESILQQRHPATADSQGPLVSAMRLRNLRERIQGKVANEGGVDGAMKALVDMVGEGFFSEG